MSDFAETLNIPALASLGIQIKPLASSSVTGDLFEHLEHRADNFIAAHGGPSVAVVKFGIHAGVNLEQRMRGYLRVNLNSVLVLHVGENLTLIECCEAFVIRMYSSLAGCRHSLRGGESMPQRNGAARFGPPYVVYCVASRADVNVAIGS